jgi:NAD-dependent SIR2 family protein deacetylase
MQRTLDDVVGALRAGSRYNRPCSLLIGAGCSATAGIRTAAGFVELIKEHHRPEYDRAKEKTYPQCMAELASGSRRDLIAGEIQRAKINWAHVAIAQFIANGYVDRVLTTNFDPLVARACALVGEFPAVYDFAASTFSVRPRSPTRRSSTFTARATASS